MNDEKTEIDYDKRNIQVVIRDTDICVLAKLWKQPQSIRSDGLT